MQARYYDPVIGRFYSNDPIGFRDVHSFNRYAYANNNPYSYIDPTGMAPESFEEWVNLGIGVGKVLESGVQTIGGTFAVGVGAVDVLAGSKVVRVALIAGGSYAVADAKYTFEDGTNKITDAWNNQSDQAKHSVPEGPLQSTAQDLGCLSECQQIAGATDKVLGAITGNISSAIVKETGVVLETVDQIQSSAGQVEKLKKIHDKIDE